MAPGVNEKHPESVVIVTKTALTEQEAQITCKKTAIIATQRVTKTHPGLGGVDPKVAS